MGRSDGLQGSGGDVDCSVGTIVWVRRRNGSWWPGRILGPNELSASHLMSPRSGTPVKLLGREDASVDWYNLEKSKRVKAFRCGEFDDCIVKAESSQGIPIKKREKYARREDAILHALELERQQLEKKQQKLGTSNSASSKIPILLKKELSAPSEPSGNDHSEFVNLKSHSISKALDSSLEEESMDNPAYAQKNKHGKQLSWEDDNSEAIPRMRGLQDFGLRIAPSKRKLSASAASEGSQRHSIDDNHDHDFAGDTRSVGGANHVSSSKNSLALKRKRSQGGLLEESLVKRRDRRRPLVQVLQSSAMLHAPHSLQSDGDAISLSMQGEKEQSGVICRAKRSRCVYLPAESNEILDHTEFSSEQMLMSPSQLEIDNGHLHPGSLTEENTSSGLMDGAESDTSRRDYLDPDVDEETAVLSDSLQTQTLVGSRNSRQYMNNINNCLVQGQAGSMSSEELDESAVSGYMSRLHAHYQTVAGAADVGMSKWQLKGKRNIRNLMKKPIDIGGKSSQGNYFEGKGNSLNRRGLERSFYDGNETLSYDYEDELIEKCPMQTQMMGFGNSRYPSLSRANSKRYGRSNVDIIDSEDDSVWEADGLSQGAYRGYWDESGECYDPTYVGHRLSYGKESMLVDVDLKVQASYQGEHVPLVSLMSRLNGKAIIGHPIQIEVLEDGATDLLLSASDDGEPMDNDGSAALTPVWRTARRTVMHRVPRPHPVTALDGEETAGPSQYSEPESKKLLAGHSNQKSKKSFSNIRQLPEKCPKKPIKKVSLSSQKTRTLSSIAIEQKSSGKGSNLKLVNKSNLGGLIKPESGPTTVTCIPVKLVFSRLLEAVGRPPSRITSHSVLVNGDTERKPS